MRSKCSTLGIRNGSGGLFSGTGSSVATAIPLLLLILRLPQRELPRPMDTSDQAASSCACVVLSMLSDSSAVGQLLLLKTSSCCSAASRSLLSTVMQLLLLLLLWGRQDRDSSGLELLSVWSDSSVWPEQVFGLAVTFLKFYLLDANFLYGTKYVMYIRIIESVFRIRVFSGSGSDFFPESGSGLAKNLDPDL